MDNRTTQLADGVWLVEVGLFTNALVVANDGHGDREGLTLVDTGRASDGARLVRSVRMLGFDPRALRDVLLTHWHAAAAGAAARFAASSAAPAVWCAAEELAVVRGAVPPPDPAAMAGWPGPLARALAGAGARQAPVPDARAFTEHPGAARTGPQTHRHASSPVIPPDIPPDIVALPGVAGGLHLVPAAGHTVGHTAVHLPARGVLHAGDALSTVAGLRASPRLLSARHEARPVTLRRLAGLEFAVLSVGHGPPLLPAAGRRGAAARLRRLAETADR